jgi:hypothetical protein
VNWQNDVAPTANQLPSRANQPFTTFQSIAAGPGGFDALPTVSFVVPNQDNDMHDGSIADGDAWVQGNLAAYYAYASDPANNSLLVITFDEDGDNTATNQITTIFAGALVAPGDYYETDLNLANPDVSRTEPGLPTLTGTAMNHWNVLATLEDMYGLARSGASAGRPAITDVWAVPEPGTAGLIGAGLALIGVQRRRRASSASRLSAVTRIDSTEGSGTEITAKSFARIREFVPARRAAQLSSDSETALQVIA